MVINMTDTLDWKVMNMVKEYIRDLKSGPQDVDTVEAIARNENALRSFFDDIRERSLAA